jgi:ATP-binding cassette subfamily C protein
LAHLLIVFVVLVAIRAAIVRLRDIELLKMRLEFVDALRNQIQSTLAMADWRFLDELSHSGILNAMLANLSRVSNGTYLLAQSVASLATGIAGVFVAVYLSPMLSLAVLAAAFLLGLGLHAELDKAASLGVGVSQAQRTFSQSAANFLSGMRLIKARGAEENYVHELNSQAASLTEKQVDFTRRQTNGRAAFECVAALFLATLLYVGFIFFHMASAELLLIVLVFARLLPLIKGWHGQLQSFWHALPAFIDIERLVRRARKAAEEVSNSSAERVELRSELTLSSVGYQYGGRETVLSDVSFSLPVRSTTALIGHSGSGKSTLADLVLGLITPTAGVILVDGRPIVGGVLREWRRTVGYVPQEAFLFPGSIRQNLQWARPTATDQELWEALDLAAASEFVHALPQGIDTLVGERGARLSGGERQRIALARALIGKPQLLVLDEATSHLDSLSESRVQAAIAGLHGQLTVLVIAHRMTTARTADNIVVIQQGRVVQQGNWESLSAQSGFFLELLQPAMD